MPKNKVRQHPSGSGQFNGRFFKPGELDTGDVPVKGGEVFVLSGVLAQQDEDTSIATVATLTNAVQLAAIALGDPRIPVQRAANTRLKALGQGGN